MRPSRRSILHRLASSAGTVALGACTMVGTPAPARVGPPEPVEADVPAVETRASDDVRSPADEPPQFGDLVVEIALESIGTPYRWGGTSANGFDCSGLIQYAYGQLGVRLPRISSDQIRSGIPVPPEAGHLRPGDVLGFSESGSTRTSHVGLYIGSHEFIHSSSSGVRVSTLRNPYWKGSLVAARRIVE